MPGGIPEDIPNIHGFEEPYPYQRKRWEIWGSVAISSIISLVIVFRPLWKSLVEVISFWMSLFDLPSATVYVGIGVSVLFIFHIKSVFHEYVHYWIRLLLGKDPEIHDLAPLSWKNPHVGIPEQWTTRGQNIIALLGPFFVLNTVALLLAVAQINPHVTLYSLSLFVANSGGATQDIIGAYDDFQLPTGSRIYYPTAHSSGYIYEPKE